MHTLIDIAMDRAINGVTNPKYYKGEVVGETRWYDNRLLMFMMRQNHSRRYGPYASDYDLSEHIGAFELARQGRNAKLLERVESLLDRYDELIGADDCETNPEAQLAEAERDHVDDRRDHLRDVRAQLIQAAPEHVLSEARELTQRELIEKMHRKRAQQHQRALRRHHGQGEGQGDGQR